MAQEIFNKKFCDRLKSVRSGLGLSQAKMAKALGLKSQQAYEYYERGGAQPSATDLLRWSSLLNISPMMLIDGEEYRGIEARIVQFLDRYLGKEDQQVTFSGKQVLAGMIVECLSDIMITEEERKKRPSSNTATAVLDTEIAKPQRQSLPSSGSGSSPKIRRPGRTVREGVKNTLASAAGSIVQNQKVDET